MCGVFMYACISCEHQCVCVYAHGYSMCGICIADTSLLGPVWQDAPILALELSCWVNML